MKSEEFAIWYVPTNGDDDLAVLIKAPTTSIKALIAGCSLRLSFGKKDNYLCIGASILDIPDAPVFISRLQMVSEDHKSLVRALKRRKFPLFLFNEMDVCLAWTNVELDEKDTYNVLKLIGQEEKLYVGTLTNEASHVHDCFCYSIDNRITYPGAHIISTYVIKTTIVKWKMLQHYFYSEEDSYSISIDDRFEGERFEREIWASLESVFPFTLHKSPQIKIGEKTRELTDVFSFYPYGSFLIEAKDLSVLNAGFHRDYTRRTAGIQKQVKKAITQLIGASKAFNRGEIIYNANGEELHINREIPSHCIVLITELMHCGDWNEIVDKMIEAMKLTGSLFHLLDLREFIALLKGSSGKAELLDYNLLERCKLFMNKQSVFIRSE